MIIDVILLTYSEFFYDYIEKYYFKSYNAYKKYYRGGYMTSYEKFYEEVEDVSVSVSVLVNVLSLYYDTLLYSQNGGNLGKSDKFCDWLYIINRYAEEVKEEIEEMLKRNMREKIN